MKLTKNIYKLITIVALIAVTVSLIIWDIIAVTKGGSESTISKVILGTSSLNQHFTIPFIWGVLTAHLFIPRRRILNHFGILMSVTLMGSITLFVVVIDIINTVSGGISIWYINFISAHLIIPLLIGGLLGWLLVPQAKGKKE